MGQKPKEDKEKPASELTDEELVKRLFPEEVRQLIEGEEPDEEDEDD